MGNKIAPLTVRFRQTDQPSSWKRFFSFKKPKKKFRGRLIAVGDGQKRQATYRLLDERVHFSRVTSAMDPSSKDRTTFANNKVRSSHYTWWNFVPLNLLDQFSRAVNFYFLVTLILSFTLEDAPVNPFSWFYGVVFVILVTMIKQGYEDYQRHMLDKKENEKSVQVLSHGSIATIRSKDVQVGDILYLQTGHTVPCDTVILSTSNRMHQAYVETSKLDGETNLKTKSSPRLTRDWKSVDRLSDCHCVVECEMPNPRLDTFLAKLHTMHDVDSTNPSVLSCTLGPENLLLSGTILQRTRELYGVCVYAGQETRIALNSKIKRHKFSTVENSLNRFFLAYFSLMAAEICLCSVLSVLAGVEYHTEELAKDPIERTEDHWYLKHHEDHALLRPNLQNAFNMFLVWFLLLNYIIPISLYCTIEVQKFFSSWIYRQDLQLYDEQRDLAAHCNNSDVTEDLGLITHLFTDKTGTLTENIMALKAFTLRGKDYDVSQLSREPWSAFLMVLTLCHSVQIDDENDEEQTAQTADQCPSLSSSSYVSSSPDEDSIVKACQEQGVELIENRLDGRMCVRVGRRSRQKKEQVHVYQRLLELSFDSYRKCMTVIVREESTGLIYVLTKGAEAVIMANSKSGPKKLIGQKNRLFSWDGLRTLVMAYKVISESEYHAFRKSLDNTTSRTLENRDEAVRDLYRQMESDFHVLGATAIEDKLQEGVYTTVTALKEAGIKIWMLTGDRKETAVTIGRAAGIIPVGSSKNLVAVLDLCKLEQEQLKERVDDALKDLEEKPFSTLLIDGHSLEYLMHQWRWRDKLLLLTMHCHTVIANRLSPIQKSQIIRLIKKADPRNITAAVGDGGNDVSMIQEAHVGFGLMGHEGSAAARSADFTFSKFRFLRRSILVHGHWFYTRLAYVIQYSFYKNTACFTCQFLFAFVSNLSAQTLYEGMFLFFFNLLFTSMPILMYGLLEQRHSAEVLLSDPTLHTSNRDNRLLQGQQMVKWIANGQYHALVLFFGWYMFWPVQFDVFGHGLDSLGYAVSGSVVFVVQAKLLFEAKYWTSPFVYTTLFSLVAYVAVTLAYSGFLIRSAMLNNSRFFSSYWHLLATPATWLVTFFLAWLALLPDVLARDWELNVKNLKEWRKRLGEMTRGK